MLKIKEIFNQRFQRWDIHLPEEDLHQRRKGQIQAQGWTINYCFDSENGREYLEYFASHRMTNDTLNRIYEDVTTELVGYCQEFYLADDSRAEEAYLEHNRNFYRMVREAGLL